MSKPLDRDPRSGSMSPGPKDRYHRRTRAVLARRLFRVMGGPVAVV